MDDKKEIVTSDAIPGRLGAWEPASKKAKEDELYKKRIKKDPSLKNNIKKIGEGMKTTVVFTSKDQSAISRQWHLLFTLSDKSWNHLDPSDIKVNNGTYTFEIESYGHDQRLANDDFLNKYLVAGVSFTKSVRESEEDQEIKLVESVLDMELDAEQLANILLGDDLEGVETPEVDSEIQEAEEDDSKDGESDTIDDVQTMLTKMLPKTKNLKLGADKEKELKSTLSKAMSLMGEEVERVVPCVVDSEELEESNKKEDVEEGTGLVITEGAHQDMEAIKVSRDMGKALGSMNDKSFEELMKVPAFKEMQKNNGPAFQAFKSAFKAAYKSKKKKESVEETSMDYPQFQFAIMVPRDDYQFSAKILNDSNIKAKTQFHQGEMAVLGFDLHQETGEGKPNVTEDEILNILNNSGIAAISAAGIDFKDEPVSIELED